MAKYMTAVPLKYTTATSYVACINDSGPYSSNTKDVCRIFCRSLSTVHVSSPPIGPRVRARAQDVEARDADGDSEWLGCGSRSRMIVLWLHPTLHLTLHRPPTGSRVVGSGFRCPPFHRSSNSPNTNLANHPLETIASQP